MLRCPLRYGHWTAPQLLVRPPRLHCALPHRLVARARRRRLARPLRQPLLHCLPCRLPRLLPRLGVSTAPALQAEQQAAPAPQSVSKAPRQAPACTPRRDQASTMRNMKGLGNLLQGQAGWPGAHRDAVDAVTWAPRPPWPGSLAASGPPSDVQATSAHFVLGSRGEPAAAHKDFDVSVVASATMARTWNASGAATCGGQRASAPSPSIP